MNKYLNGKLDLMSHIEAALDEAALHGHMAIVNMLLSCQRTLEPARDGKWSLFHSIWATFSRVFERRGHLID